MVAALGYVIDIYLKKKNQQTTKKHAKFPSRQRVDILIYTKIC